VPADFGATLDLCVLYAHWLPQVQLAASVWCCSQGRRGMGGHSVTGKFRSKRADARLPPKQRRAAARRDEERKTAAHLRVVKIKKSERKARTVDASAMRLAKPKLSNVEKKVKALRKKLVQIAALRERQEAGDQMDANQLQKLASEASVREDLEAWAAALLPAAGGGGSGS
jgi:uncharacterized protein with WD repeat